MEIEEGNPGVPKEPEQAVISDNNNIGPIPPPWEKLGLSGPPPPREDSHFTCYYCYSHDRKIWFAQPDMIKKPLQMLGVLFEVWKISGKKFFIYRHAVDYQDTRSELIKENVYLPLYNIVRKKGKANLLVCDVFHKGKITNHDIYLAIKVRGGEKRFFKVSDYPEYNGLEGWGTVIRLFCRVKGYETIHPIGLDETWYNRFAQYYKKIDNELLTAMFCHTVDESVDAEKERRAKSKEETKKETSEVKEEEIKEDTQMKKDSMDVENQV